ncbi:hypothetical protein GCM10022395_06520 [Snuella lapsa]|uniref:Uncharacterized protein n=1 Tax=Snuella lapsa TaxID=870481 RepID=A0ABP6WYD1_9FLAO
MLPTITASQAALDCDAGITEAMVIIPIKGTYSYTYGTTLLINLECFPFFNSKHSIILSLYRYMASAIEKTAETNPA